MNESGKLSQNEDTFKSILILQHAFVFHGIITSKFN